MRWRSPHVQADLRCVRAAQVALGWVVVFTGFHVYWYLGGSLGSPGELPGEPHSLAGWTFQVFVVGAFVLGFLVCLAIARGWAGGRLAKPAAILVWAGCVILVLRGGAGVVDDLTRAAGVRTGITGLSTKDTTGATDPAALWSGWAIDGYFLAGGMIFTWLVIRHRQLRQSSRPSRSLARATSCLGGDCSRPRPRVEAVSHAGPMQSPVLLGDVVGIVTASWPRRRRS